MKVLVTGASGLLGSDVVLRLEKSGYEVIKASFNKRPDYIAVDLSSEKDIDVLKSMEWDVVVHCAAWRDPDNCASNNEGAKLANITATQNITKLASDRGAKVIYISTDYIFPGTNAPYAEDAEPNPINFYGKTKLAGEKIVLEASPKNVSLRVPALYGMSAGLERASMLSYSLNIIETPNKEFQVDDIIIKYPTFTGDVANAIFAIIEKNVNGIFHCSGKEKMSKYKIHLAMCNALGCNSSNVSPSMIYSASAERPVDSHLSTERLDRLNLAPQRPFEEIIKEFHLKS